MLTHNGFWVIKKLDIFLGVLIFSCYEKHTFRTKRFLPIYFTSICYIYYFYRLNFWFSEPKNLLWFLKSLRLAIVLPEFQFFLHYGTCKYILRKPFSTKETFPFFVSCQSSLGRKIQSEFYKCPNEPSFLPKDTMVFPFLYKDKDSIKHNGDWAAKWRQISLHISSSKIE